MKLTPILAIAVLSLVSLAGSAAAHASQNTSDGKIKITWGWLDEPAYTNQKNRLDLIIRDAATNQGIGGLGAANFTEVSLHSPVGDAEYSLGNVSAYAGAKGASVGAGNYTSANPVIPTAPGVYTLHIVGNVQGSAFDIEIPASHAVDDDAALAFPAKNATADNSATLADLSARVAALEAKAKTASQTSATVTPQPTPAKGIPVPTFVAALGVVAIAAFVAGRRR